MSGNLEIGTVLKGVAFQGKYLEATVVVVRGLTNDGHVAFVEVSKYADGLSHQPMLQIGGWRQNGRPTEGSWLSPTPRRFPEGLGRRGNPGYFRRGISSAFGRQRRPGKFRLLIPGETGRVRDSPGFSSLPPALGTGRWRSEGVW